ncbi:MAG: hypothetical protein J6A01_05865 [Proteobacteria bacterium]|nr:hypothetical protein [Pseudomonadota bacterium]
MKKLALFIIPILLMGCEASLGDKCDTSNDCPSGMICDTDSPSGYCIVVNCEGDEECPDNAVCVKFTSSISYCLKKCKSKSDCRSGYACRDDIGDQKFCYVEADYPYGRDETNQIEFVPPEETGTEPAGEDENSGGESNPEP